MQNSHVDVGDAVGNGDGASLGGADGDAFGLNVG